MEESAVCSEDERNVAVCCCYGHFPLLYLCQEHLEKHPVDCLNSMHFYLPLSARSIMPTLTARLRFHTKISNLRYAGIILKNNLNEIQKFQERLEEMGKQIVPIFEREVNDRIKHTSERLSALKQAYRAELDKAMQETSTHALEEWTPESDSLSHLIWNYDTITNSEPRVFQYWIMENETSLSRVFQYSFNSDLKVLKKFDQSADQSVIESENAIAKSKELQVKLSALEERINQVEASKDEEIAMLNAQIMQAEEDRSALVAAHEEVVQALKEKASGLRSQLDDSMNESSKLIEQIKKLNQELEESKMKRMKLDEHIKKLENEVQTLRATEADLRLQITTMRENHAAQIQQLEKNAADQREKEQRATQSINRDLKASRDEVQKLRAAEADLRLQIATMRENHAAQIQQLEKNAADQREEEQRATQSINRDLKASRDEVQKLRTAEADLRLQITTIKRDNTAQVQQLEKNAAEREQRINRELETSRAEVQRLRAAEADLRLQITTIKRDNTAQVQQLEKNAAEREQRINRELETSRAEVQILRATEVDLRLQMQQLEKNAADQREKEQRATQSFNRDLKACRDEVQKLKAAEADLRLQLSTKRENYAAQIQQLEKNAADQREKEQRIHKDLEASKAEVQRLKNVEADQKLQIATIKRDNTAQVQQLERASKDLKTSKDDTDANVKRLERELQSSQDYANRQVAEVTRLRGQISRGITMEMIENEYSQNSRLWTTIIFAFLACFCYSAYGIYSSFKRYK